MVQHTRVEPDQVGLLARVLHMDGVPYVVIPLFSQFCCQEYNLISAHVAGVIHARGRNYDTITYSAPIRHCYADYTAGFIPLELYDTDDVVFTANAVAHNGINTAPDDKKAVALILTEMVAMYDVSNMNKATIGVPKAVSLKLVCLLFLELPRVFTPGETRLKLKTFMRINSYMYLVSNYIPRHAVKTFAAYQPPNAHHIIGTDAATSGPNVPRRGAEFTAHAQCQPIHLWGNTTSPPLLKPFASPTATRLY